MEYEKKSENQLHRIAEQSHQKHKSVTGQVPGIRDDEGDDDGNDEGPQVYRGPEYATIPKE